MIKKRSQLLWLALLVIFVLALLPRLLYPVTWPLQWYTRSVAFYDALAEGNLADTFQKLHPGVTTMWVAGLGLRVFAAVNDWTPADLMSPPVSPEGIRDFPEEAGVAALAVVISLGIVLAAFLLVKLWGFRTGVAGGVLLALDPFLLTYSKVLHVDGMVAITMILSALFLLNYQRDERRLYLWLSGVLGGLAFLSKTPSVFLLPFTALVLVGGAWLNRPAGVNRWAQIRAAAGQMLQWWLAAGLTFVLFWPAMWVMPGQILGSMWNGIVKHVANPHPGNFFAGQIIYGDVGPLFYPATIAWKTTFLTLPGALIAGVLITRRGLRQKASQAAFWVVAYVLSFTLMMTLASGKETRYILPVFPALDVLAAWGLSELAGRLAQNRPAVKRWLPAVLGLLLLGQGVSVLRHHPYYSLHHNPLLGGTPVAARVLPFCDQGEGLEKAAEFLNQYPGAYLIEVGVPERFHHLFYRHFAGATRELGQTPVDFVVFAINSTQRRADADAYQLFLDANPGIEPVWSLEQDGVTFVSVYPSYPRDPQALAMETPLDIQFGDQIHLLGYDLDPGELQAGRELAFNLAWQIGDPVVEDLHVFAHLLDDEGQIVAQADGVPQNGQRPTWSWLPGEVLLDPITLALPAELPAGRYRLLVGLYDFGTGIRVPAVDAGGQRWPDDAVLLIEFGS